MDNPKSDVAGRMCPVWDCTGEPLAPTRYEKAQKLAAKGKGCLEVGTEGVIGLRLTYTPPPPGPMPVGVPGKKARWRKTTIKALIERDGENCFYCLLPMAANDITIEHLLATKNGGSSSRANLVLAHERCNHLAGHLSVMAKIRMREQNLGRCSASGSGWPRDRR